MPETGAEMMAALTVREEALAWAYLHAGGNKTEAYHRVYPHLTRDSARSEGARVFADPSLMAAVEKCRSELRERQALEVETVAERLRMVALGNMRDVASWGRMGMVVKESDALTEEQAALIDEIQVERKRGDVKIRLKLQNRQAAARLLLELRGELKKLHKVEGEIRHVMALPEKQPTAEEWAEQYGPRKALPPADTEDDTEDDE